MASPLPTPPQRQRLGMVQRLKNGAAVILAQLGLGQQRQYPATGRGESGHGELRVSSANHLGQSEQDRRDALGRMRRIGENRAAWAHWNGSEWGACPDLTKLPGFQSLRKAEA